MQACGQISAHLLHWMQRLGTQVGMSRAMERFSHCAVAVGQVPSTGKAETGNRSPLPARISEVTRWTKSGATEETAGGRGFPLTCLPATLSSWRLAKVWSTASKFLRTTSAPLRW